MYSSSSGNSKLVVNTMGSFGSSRIHVKSVPPSLPASLLARTGFLPGRFSLSPELKRWQDRLQRFGEHRIAHLLTSNGARLITARDSCNRGTQHHDPVLHHRTSLRVSHPERILRSGATATGTSPAPYAPIPALLNPLG